MEELKMMHLYVHLGLIPYSLLSIWFVILISLDMVFYQFDKKNLKMFL